MTRETLPGSAGREPISLWEAKMYTLMWRGSLLPEGPQLTRGKGRFLGVARAGRRT